jgi:mercuric ion transport protein
MDTRRETIQATGTAGQAARQGLAVTGGLLGGLAAMSCCIMPLVLFSLGAGGAWIGNLTALAPYQPIFVTMALGSIGYGFWLVYRRREACADGDACARPLPKRSVKLGLWAATFMTAAALAFPFVAPILLGI